MSLKRSHAGGRSSFGGAADAGAKVDRQELFDQLKGLATSTESFTPVDIALAIGAGEPQVSKALLGLAAEGYLEKMDVGRYRSAPMSDMTQAEFLKAFARASKVDSTRQRDLSEIARLKQNNDTMRQRLLAAMSERDHYLAVLRRHGIDPGPAPAAAGASSEPAAAASPSPAPTAGPAAAPSAPPLAAVATQAVPAAVPAEVTEPTGAPPSLRVAPPEAIAVQESSPGPAGVAVPSPPSENAPSGPGDMGGHGAPPGGGHGG